jgi:hypothetical protein
MAGKGDKRRPLKVSKAEFDNSWDSIFNRGKNMDLLTANDLSEVKLIDEDNIASAQDVREHVSQVLLQGTGGWGVGLKDAIVLRLVKDLHAALEQADGADESARKIKGLQLENGRLRAQLNRLSGEG